MVRVNHYLRCIQVHLNVFQHLYKDYGFLFSSHEDRAIPKFGLLLMETKNWLLKLPELGHPTIWIRVGQGPIALAVGAVGGCLDSFTLLCLFSPLSSSFWETAPYRLKYCLKGPIYSKSTNQSTLKSCPM